MRLLAFYASVGITAHTVLTTTSLAVTIAMAVVSVGLVIRSFRPL